MITEQEQKVEEISRQAELLIENLSLKTKTDGTDMGQREED